MPPLTRTRTLSCATLLLLLITACGDSKADVAVREALAPLVHRNRSLTDEYVRWVDREEAGGVTWGQSFEQMEKFLAAKDTTLSLVRGIVPTERYDCIIKLVSRSIEADKAAIASRLNHSRQRLRARTQMELAEEHFDDARTSYYSADMYRRAGARALGEAEDALTQSNAFKVAGNREALAAQMLADTLAATILSIRLLPSSERQRYPIVTDSGPDSLLQLTEHAPAAACAR